LEVKKYIHLEKMILGFSSKISTLYLQIQDLEKIFYGLTMEIKIGLTGGRFL